MFVFILIFLRSKNHSYEVFEESSFELAIIIWNLFYPTTKEDYDFRAYLVPIFVCKFSKLANVFPQLFASLSGSDQIDF